MNATTLVLNNQASPLVAPINGKALRIFAAMLLNGGLSGQVGKHAVSEVLFKARCNTENGCSTRIWDHIPNFSQFVNQGIGHRTSVKLRHAWRHRQFPHLTNEFFSVHFCVHVGKNSILSSRLWGAV